MNMVPFERQPAEIVRVSFLDGFIETVLIDNEPHVVLKPAIEDAKGGAA